VAAAFATAARPHGRFRVQRPTCRGYDPVVRKELHADATPRPSLLPGEWPCVACNSTLLRNGAAYPRNSQGSAIHRQGGDRSSARPDASILRKVELSAHDRIVRACAARCKVGWGLAIGGQHGSANDPMPNDGSQFFHGHEIRQQNPHGCPVHKDHSSLSLLRLGAHLGTQGRAFGAKRFTGRVDCVADAVNIWPPGTSRVCYSHGPGSKTGGHFQEASPRYERFCDADRRRIHIRDIEVNPILRDRKLFASQLQRINSF
jgi:hypothetical protein